jgi:putative tricarboxylic transport membrane protein
MKRTYLLSLVFWLGLGLFVLVHSYRLGLMTLNNPGPGLMPFIIGLLLSLVSLYLILVSFLKKGRTDETTREEPKKGLYGRIGVIVGALVAYAFLMERLGFLIATTFLLIALFKGAGSKKWRTVVISSVLVSVITYFAFTHLRLRLPAGILRF